MIKDDGCEVASEFNGKKNDKDKAVERSCAFALLARITQYLAEFLPLNLVQVCFHSAKRLRFKKHTFYIFDYILPSEKNQVFSSPKEKEIIRSTRL